MKSANSINGFQQELKARNEKLIKNAECLSNLQQEVVHQRGLAQNVQQVGVWGGKEGGIREGRECGRECG